MWGSEKCVKKGQAQAIEGRECFRNVALPVSINEDTGVAIKVGAQERVACRR